MMNRPLLSTVAGRERPQRGLPLFSGNVSGCRFICDRSDHRSSRSAATLAEVLISMLIMSIGLVSVASLFPLAVARTSHANFLTNGTVLRYNVEQLLEFYPHILDNAPYRDLSGAVRPPESGVSWIDPLGFVSVGGNRPAVYDAAGTLTAVTDPDQFVGRSNLYAAFGNLGVRRVSGFGILAPLPAQSRYFPGTFKTAESAAQSIATLPDNWSVQHEGLLSSVDSAAADPLVITVDGLAAATPQGGFGGGTVSLRCTFLTSDGRRSFTLVPTAVNNSQISFVSTITSSLPFTPALVRLEAQVRRFTWLLSVRRDAPGPAICDVVVFNNRNLVGPEQLATAATRDTTLFVNADEQPHATAFVEGNRIAFLYNRADPENGTVTIPDYARKGRFVFDADNGYWYRIQDVGEKPIRRTIRNYATVDWNVIPVTLETPAKATSPDLNPAAGVADGIPGLPIGGMYPRGVIEVFPLGLKGRSP